MGGAIVPGTVSAMRVRIDAAGRLVIPRALRRVLGVEGAGDVEVVERGDRLEVRPAPTPMRTERSRGGVLMLRPEQELPALSIETVREALDRSRQPRANG